MVREFEVTGCISVMARLASIRGGSSFAGQHQTTIMVCSNFARLLAGRTFYSGLVLTLATVLAAESEISFGFHVHNGFCERGQGGVSCLFFFQGRFQKSDSIRHP